jgi:hypothetical protein
MDTSHEKIKFGREVVSLRRETFDKILGSSIAELFTSGSPNPKPKPKPQSNRHPDRGSASRKSKAAGTVSRSSNRNTSRLESKAYTHVPSIMEEDTSSVEGLEEVVSRDVTMNSAQLMNDHSAVNPTQQHASSPAITFNTLPASSQINDISILVSYDEKFAKLDLESISSLRSFSRHFLKQLDKDASDGDFESEIRRHSAYLDTLAANLALRDPMKELKESLLLPVDAMRHQVMRKVFSSNTLSSVFKLCNVLFVAP